MEVLHPYPQSESAMFLHGGSPGRPSPHLFAASKDVFTCYGFEASSLPSRTPSPEHRAQVCTPPSPPAPCPPCSGTTTLQSVLMGQVPAAYSHLTSARRNLPSSSASSTTSSSSSSSSSCVESMEEEPVTVQTEPMDLSCKRSGPSPSHPSHPALPASPCPSGSSAPEFSLLRNLLSVGKAGGETCFSAVSGASSPPRPGGSPGERCETPDSDRSSDCAFSRPASVVTGATRVTLAKKNMYPVCSRVTDWLYKLVDFTKSIPEFMNLSHNDKVTLILNSWSKLMLLYMAESNFQFAVTPLRADQCSGQQLSPSAGEPTMRAVDGVQSFIRKCQQMNLDGKEYAFMKMLVLFNSSYVGLDRADIVEQLNSVVQHLLKQHVDSRGLDDVMHFSRLLLGLPALYGIESKMVENLFCRHIIKNTDMEVLLKEMLQSYS